MKEEEEGGKKKPNWALQVTKYWCNESQGLVWL